MTLIILIFVIVWRCSNISVRHRTADHEYSDYNSPGMSKRGCGGGIATITRGLCDGY